jgi:hypothetical protein
MFRTFSRESRPEPTAVKPRPVHSRALSASALQREMGNRGVEHLAMGGQLPVSALASIGNRAIQRYFDLATATHEGLGVRASESARFPGHEQDEGHPDFLNPNKTVNRVERESVPDLSVADDGRMAIESAAVGGNREVEAFFAESTVVSEGNTALERVKSQLRLKPVGGETVDVPDLRGTTRHQLGKVIAQQAPVAKPEVEKPKEESEGSKVAEVAEPPSGPTLLAPEQCVAIAQAIIGQSGLVLKVANADAGLYSENDMRERMLQFLAGYIEAASKDPAEARPGKQAAYIEAAKSKAKTKVPFEIVMKTMTERFVTLEAYGGDRDTVDGALKKLNSDGVLTMREDPINTDWAWTSGWLGYAKYSKRFRITSQREAGDSFVRSSISGSLNGKLLRVDLESRERQTGPDVERTGANIDRAMDGVLAEVQRNPGLMAEANKHLRMNEYANPTVGEAYMIFHKGAKQEDQNFPYHFAAVVAQSGEDRVTLENYARDTHENESGSSNRMYFQMYGPKREVAVAEGQVRPQRGEGTPEEQEAREYAAGSFHGRWEGLFSAPSTVTVKKG